MKYILAVEDDSTQSKLTEKILHGINCEVIMAARGKEALEIIENRKNEIGLILLDLSLPDIGGLQILEELNNKKVKIPTAILSINEEAATIVEAIKAGADNFFIKYKDEAELKRLYSYIESKLHPKLS